MIIPTPEHTVLTVIDVQEKLLKAIPALQLDRVKLLIQGCRAMNMSSIVTEQYPQGLGNTVPEVSSLYENDWSPIAKNSFSCCMDETFMSALKQHTECKSVILCGVESHVCVQQTAIDLLNAGYQVIIPVDAVASRHDFDRGPALELMKEAGAVMTTVESLLFMLLRTSKHPAFKTISKLVR